MREDNAPVVPGRRFRYPHPNSASAVGWEIIAASGKSAGWWRLEKPDSWQKE